MQFGQIQKSSLSAPVAHRVTKPTKIIHFLCDGGSRPNPGTSLPLLHNGSRFLPVPPKSRMGNHKAVYEGIDFALDYAFQQNATDVVISLSAYLVWQQLAKSKMIDKLAGRHSSTMTKVGNFNSVLWQLVGPPFILPGQPAILSRRALRRAGARALAPAAMSSSSAIIHSATSGTAATAGASSVSIGTTIPGVLGTAGLGSVPIAPVTPVSVAGAVTPTKSP